MRTSGVSKSVKSCCRPELFRSRILELNASDERGIQVSVCRYVHVLMCCGKISPVNFCHKIYIGRTILGVKLMWVGQFLTLNFVVVAIFECKIYVGSAVFFKICGRFSF